MKALDIIQTINKFGKTRYFKGFLPKTDSNKIATSQEKYTK